MAVLPILQDPDPRLRQKSLPVVDFNEDLSLFVADLIDTMYAEKGAGIAAPQVGRHLRVCLVDTKETGLLVLVNPTITARSGTQVGAEGCLSLAGKTSKVARASEISVRAVDETGQPFEGKFSGFTARAIQHEVDHLDGILMTDRAKAR